MKHSPEINVIIGADIVPRGDNMSHFVNGNISALVGEHIMGVLRLADARVFNLECPLTDIESPIQKVGRNYRAPVSAINGIAALDPSVISIANNHILDQGEQGMRSTIDTLASHSINIVGGGYY